MPPDPDFIKYLCQVSPEPDGLVISRAAGSWLTDDRGRRYLDWLAGIGVLNTGHLHPKVTRAIKRQLKKHLHVMVYGEYAQKAQTELARMLCRLAPINNARVYFASSGTEAIEGALKIARKWTKRARFVAFEGAYHGGTIGALSLVGRRDLRAPFLPLLDCLHLPYGDTRALSRIDRRVAAVVVEPIQAEGGVRVPPDEFLAELKKRCTRIGALLIFDEIQTGLGRTGKLWCSEHWQVNPDILVLAKAVGGGLPLGAILASARLLRTFSANPPFSHLTTFGGHPLSCAAGLAALRLTLKRNLPAAAERMGRALVQGLAESQAAGLISDVRGRGLLLGIALKSPARARAVIDRCRRAGLLIGSALHDESVLRLTPPLTMSARELALGLAILRAALLKSRPRAGRSKGQT